MSVSIPEHFGESQEQEVRELFISHRDFLKNLCTVEPWRNSVKLLAGASDESLNVVALVVYLTAAKRIKISSANRQALFNSRKITSIRTFFGDRDKYNNFLKLERAEKLKRLQKIGLGLAICLRSLFYSNSQPEPPLPKEDPAQ